MAPQENILFYLFILMARFWGFFGGLLFRATTAAYGIPGRGVELELQLPAYATATAARESLEPQLAAMPDP